MPDPLTFSAGDPLAAESLRALAALGLEVRAGQLRLGPSLPGRQLPDGIIPILKLKGAAAAVTHPFQISVEAGDAGSAKVRFTTGTAGGVELTIDGKPVDQPDAAGELPALIVKAADFAPYGTRKRSLVYLRYTLDPASWAITKVEPVAYPKKPAAASYVWHKLAAYLFQDDGGSVTPLQMIFFNQGFAAGGKRGPVGFTPFPWAT